MCIKSAGFCIGKSYCNYQLCHLRYVSKGAITGQSCSVILINVSCLSKHCEPAQEQLFIVYIMRRRYCCIYLLKYLKYRVCMRRYKTINDWLHCCLKLIPAFLIITYARLPTWGACFYPTALAFRQLLNTALGPLISFPSRLIIFSLLLLLPSIHLNSQAATFFSLPFPPLPPSSPYFHQQQLHQHLIT